jgi:hypothetical protein
MRFWGILGAITWCWGVYFGVTVPHGAVCALETTTLVLLGALMVSIYFVNGPLTKWIEG